MKARNWITLAVIVVVVLAGTMLGDLGRLRDYAILVVCLLMGAHLTGLLSIPMPSVNVRPRWRGLPGASAGLAKGLVASKGLAKAGAVPRFAAGILIAAVGVYLFVGRA